VLIQAGTDDILLSDSERIAAALAAARVEVELHAYEGLWHVFQAHTGILPEAEAAIAKLGEFLAARCAAGRLV
jgi:monoterpene epsilon-lactone hydrolase